MSLIGENPVLVPSSVQVTIQDDKVTIKGSKGELHIDIQKGTNVEFADGKLTVSRLNETKKVKSLHGLVRSLLQNAVTGVEKPWEKHLEVFGTGYKVKMQGQGLVFDVGLSHQVHFAPVESIMYTVNAQKVVVSGIDKQLVGEIANKIKVIRKPDPYKGKGIRYEGEVLHLKPGKKAKTA